MVEPIIFSPLIKTAFTTKQKCYRGKLTEKKKFWFKKWLHVMEVHFQMHRGQLGTQNPLKMKANWDHNSHLCLQNLLLKERRALLGSVGNPVTFLLKPPQALQNTAETWAVDSAAAFRRAQSGKQLLWHRPPSPTSQVGGRALKRGRVGKGRLGPWALAQKKAGKTRCLFTQVNSRWRWVYGR